MIHGVPQMRQSAGAAYALLCRSAAQCGAAVVLSSALIMLPTVAHSRVRDNASAAVEVTADIAPRCDVEAQGPRSATDLRIDWATRVQFDFRLDCNAPFRIGLATQNGGLRHAAAGSVAAGNGANVGALDADGFATILPYDVALRFDTDQAGWVDAGSCASAALISSAGGCRFYGRAAGEGLSPGARVTAIARTGTLAISWAGDGGDDPSGNPARARLAAGDYADIITLVVGPRT